MDLLTASFITLCLTLIPVTNPIGMAPIFLSFTTNLSKKERRGFALQVAMLAFFFLIGTLIFGPILLKFFGISLSFIKISGGLLLAITGWQMLMTTKLENQERDGGKDINPPKTAFFPLAFPITVGAGSIAIVTTLASSYNNPEFTISAVVLNYAGGILAIAVDMALVAICYGFSEEIFSKLGETGTEVVTKVTAFILMAIGFQVAWGGLQNVIIETVKIIKNLPL